MTLRIGRSSAWRSLKVRACLNFMLAALFVFALAPRAALASEAALAAKAADLGQLDAAIAEQGSVRVIVELAGVAHPAGDASASALEEHGARLSVVQDGLLRDLSGGNSKASDAWHVRKLSISPLVAMTVNRADLVRLAAHPGVARISEDSRNFVNLAQSVPLIGMTNAYAGGATGANAIVAIVDTGVDKTHDFFSGGSRVIAEACFSTNTTFSNANVTSNCPGGVTSSTATGAAVPTACVGTSGCDHGTHVAGIAAGNAAARTPTNGVAKSAGIFAVNVFSKYTYNNTGTNPCGSAPTCVSAFNSDIIAALNHIYSRRASFPGKVIAAINMSLGNGTLNTGYCDTSSLKAPIDTLRAAGIATVIAAGNEFYTTGVAHPGCISSAVTVGSTTKADLVSGFSNVGPQVDLLAPGSSITASIFSNAMGVKSGTSMATPHVVGAFAALRSAVPSATVDQIENALKATGLNITDSTPRADGSSGSGLVKPRIRVDLALNQLLGSGGPVLSLSPSSGFTSTGMAGGPFSPSSQVYVVTNAGSGSMSWSASSSDTTVATVSPASGTLATGASVNVTVAIPAAANSKAAGSYSSSVSFTNSTNSLGNTAVLVSLSVTPPPATNDNFANAIVLSGSSGSVTTTNATATRETGEPRHYAGTSGARSLWWKWTAPSTGQAVFTTSGSAFDTVLAIYTGSTLTTLTQIISNDDTAGLTSRVAFNAVGGTTYYIAVDGFGSTSSGQVSLGWTFTTSQGPVVLAGSILPYARSVQTGTGATAFANIFNASGVAATGCTLQMPSNSGAPGVFQFQTTNASNQLTGSPNLPVDIPAGSVQNFVFGFTPSAPFSARDLAIVMDCENAAPAGTVTGVNTFLLSASSTPVPDLVAIGATPGGDGIVHIPGNTGTGFFAAAAVNIGAAGTITATADDGGRGLSLQLSVCQTNSTGACLAPPAASPTAAVANNQVVTYAVFVTGTGSVAFNPATNRLFLRLKDSGGTTRGATHVAVCTSTDGSCPAAPASTAAVAADSAVR